MSPDLIIIQLFLHVSFIKTISHSKFIGFYVILVIQRGKMQNLNEDFNTALNIYENDYSHKDLIGFLKNGSVAQKQASVLKLDSLKTLEDAKILMQNLTGCDGKIREAVSFRLPEFVSANPEYFLSFEDIFLDAIIDINGNICRNTISAITYLKNNKEFCAGFCTKLAKRTLELSKIASAFDPQDGKYKVNKEIFKLYWYLETIYNFAEQIDKPMLKEIIAETKGIRDYTIREKTAKVLSKLSNLPDFSAISNELKNDTNYYVRRI